MSLLNHLIPSLTREPSAVAADADRATQPAVKPRYEIKESPDAWGVTVYLPGVAKDGLDFTAEEGELRIVGRRAWQQPAGWTPVYRESAAAPFSLVLTHDQAVDVDRIAAELRDGVLRVSLPKPETLKPRKIAIN